jgi:hypothetical protein
MVHNTTSHHHPLLITHTPKLPKLSPLSHLYVHRVGNVDDRPTSFPLAALSLPRRLRPASRPAVHLNLDMRHNVSHATLDAPHRRYALSLPIVWRIDAARQKNA